MVGGSGEDEVEKAARDRVGSDLDEDRGRVEQSRGVEEHEVEGSVLTIAGPSCRR